MPGHLHDLNPRTIPHRVPGRMRTLQYTLVVLLIAAGMIYLAPYVGSEPTVAEEPAKVPKKEKQKQNADSFFTMEGPIPELKFEFDPEEWEYLNKDNRRYVECVMTEAGGRTHKGVAVKLKGSAGSFRGPNDKPGLTVSMGKYKGGDPFRGMEKFHLNNGAQDGTFLMEMIAGEMARKAGVPASRCSQALVTLNGKEHGLYLFKEGFTKDFLTHFFKKADGDLYDGGFVRELEVGMEKDMGDPKQRDNIKELIGACQDGEHAKRWARLDAILDVDKFLSHLAMESILTHWDGYDFNRNNYRVYFDSETKKAVFFLHGMDQTFGDASTPVTRDSGAMVGQAVLSNPLWKAKYRDRVKEIYETVLKPNDWAQRINEVGQKVQAALAKKNPKWAQDYQGQINAARDRVTQRIANVGKQVGDVPKPPQFDKDNALKLTEGWAPESGAGGDSAMDEVAADGKKSLHIRANSASAGSWRRTMNLPPGRYRFEARVKTAGVVAMDDAKNKGAALRISGGAKGTDSAEGDCPWKTLAYSFESPGGDVILVAELRGQKGDAWFERDSLRLVWMK